MSKKIVLVLVVAVAALGAGVGFVTLALSARRPAADSTPRPAVPSFVIEEEQDPVRAEAEVEGHRDLRFRNRGDRPVTVRLEETDCGCAHVLAWVAPEAWGGLGPQEFLKRAEELPPAWQTLEQGGKGFTAPPAAEGLLRLQWTTPSVGDHRFWARLGLDDGQDRGSRQVEVPVHLVALVRLRPEDGPDGGEVDVGRLNAGGERTARLLCYSQTRDKFTLLPAPPGNDPCVSYGTPQPLTREEMQALSGKVGTAVRAGYRVTVTVREQAGDNRLDMGPFRRRVVWKTDVIPGHQVSTHVNGTVRGEVWLAAPLTLPSPPGGEGRVRGEDESVDLGLVLPTDPKPLIFTLHSSDPQLRLTLDGESTVEFLKVELLGPGEERDNLVKEGADAGGKSWRVRVLFRTDSLFRGPFPNPARPGYDSAGLCSVVFFVSRQGEAGQPPRRLFVPVRGTVRGF
jgi:hypothetical protein